MRKRKRQSTTSTYRTWRKKRSNCIFQREHDATAKKESDREDCEAIWRLNTKVHLQRKTVRGADAGKQKQEEKKTNHHGKNPGLRAKGLDSIVRLLKIVEVFLTGETLPSL